MHRQTSSVRVTITEKMFSMFNLEKRNISLTIRFFFKKKKLPPQNYAEKGFCLLYNLMEELLLF